jgi:hypothetical protein
MSDLIERLRRTYGAVECAPGHSYFGKSSLKNVNPDGPEAADEIERLRALLGRFAAHDDDARQNPLGGVSLGGLMDCRDNSGCVYQSQALADDLAAARAVQPSDDRKEA